MSIGEVGDIEKKEEQFMQELYRVYEFADGLYFPKMKFRCGSIDNYVKTGILSKLEAEELWNGNVIWK